MRRRRSKPIIIFDSFEAELIILPHWRRRATRLETAKAPIRDVSTAQNGFRHSPSVENTKATDQKQSFDTIMGRKIMSKSPGAASLVFLAASILLIVLRPSATQATLLVMIPVLILALFAWNRSLKKKVNQRTAELKKGIAERNKAEKALRESERKFAEAFMSCPAALSLSSFESGRFMDVNHAFVELTGYGREEIIGRTSAEMGLWPNRSQRKLLFSRIGKDGFLENAEIDLKIASGKTRTGLMSAEIVEIDGEACLLAQVIDITDRKTAENALRKQEENYRIVADFFFDWEYWLGPDGRFEYTSPSCRRITGYSADEFAGNPNLLTEIVHEDDRETFSNHVAFYSKGKKAPELQDFRIRTSDGRVKWINHRCQPVFGDDGSFRGIRASNRDITDRKTVEERIRTSESMFKAINENTRDVTVVLDRNLAYKYVSPSITKVAGFAPDDLIGKTPAFIIHRDDLAEANEYFEKALSNPGKTITTGILRAKLKDGGYRYIEARVTNLFDEPGIEGLVINSRNVTEKMKLKEELNQAYRMEAIGALAGGIAHDFNNILSSIIGYAELALEDAKSENNPGDNIRKIFKAGFRATALAHSVLSYSRRSSGKEVPCMVGFVLGQATELLRAAIPSSIKIDVEIAGDSMVATDPVKLRQLVTSLCTNRARAMEEEGGSLKIGLKNIDIDEELAKRFRKLKPGRHIELTISDTCTETAGEDLEAILAPFVSTGENGGREGTGLANARLILGDLRGEIRVEGKKRGGLVFKVYLPSVPEFSGLREQEEKARPCGDGKILIVDDDRSVAEMTGQLLERQGYLPTVCTDSVQALDLFNSDPHRFDLVITDMVMPGLTGEELSCAMLANRPDIPIVLCTGFSKALSKEKALKIGIRAVVYKPIVRKGLIDTIGGILEKRKHSKP